MLRNKTEGIFVRIPELINRVLSCNFKNTLVKYFKYLLENCYVVIYKLKTIISIFCDQYTTLIFFHELGIIYYTQSYENFTMVNLQLCV